MNRLITKVSVLILLAAPAFASGQKPTACDFDPACDHNQHIEPVRLVVAEQRFQSVAQYADPTSAVFGIKPQEGEILSLNGMVIFQKVKDGYIIVTGDHLEASAWLKTKQEHGQGEPLAGSAKVVGIYRYVGMDGFKHDVWAVEEIQ